MVAWEKDSFRAAEKSSRQGNSWTLPVKRAAESEGGASTVNTEPGPPVKEQLANPDNYGEARTADQIRYLVIHYTGNDGDTAANNAAYYQRTVVRASAHYFVDDTDIYRSVPELRTAWAVGGKGEAGPDGPDGAEGPAVFPNLKRMY